MTSTLTPLNSKDTMPVGLHCEVEYIGHGFRQGARRSLAYPSALSLMKLPPITFNKSTSTAAVRTLSHPARTHPQKVPDILHVSSVVDEWARSQG